MVYIIAPTQIDFFNYCRNRNIGTAKLVQTVKDSKKLCTIRHRDTLALLTGYSNTEIGKSEKLKSIIKRFHKNGAEVRYE